MKRYGYEIYQNTEGDVVVRQESGLTDSFIVVTVEQIEMLCKDLLTYKEEVEVEE